MSKSYKKIDYSLRTNKSIERKALFSALSKLPLDFSKHEYIGFGSMWFIDFILAHQNLEIIKMISLEIGNFKRAEFNRPLKCIEVIHSLSTQYLKDRDWSKSSIIWLDYDGPVNPTVIEDLDIIKAGANENDVLLITVNANPRNYGETYDEFCQTMTDYFGDIFPSSPNKNLRGNKRFKQFIALMLIESIKDGLYQRGKSLNFHAFLNISYNDGVQMVTVGGIFTDEIVEEGTDLAIWTHKYGERLGSESNQVSLDVPLLTRREKLTIDRLMMPAEETQEVEIGTELRFLSAKNLDEYKKWYNYYPMYTEIAVF